MTIRSRLFMWFLPLLIAFVALVSSFFYLNWYWEIISGFKAHLESIVISSSELFNPDDIAWIDQHRHDPDISQSAEYQRSVQKLEHLEDKLSFTDLYIIAIEPVKKGEPVLLDQPSSDTNKIYDGVDKSYAYREVYLLDVSRHTKPSIALDSGQTMAHRTGDYDFTESQEHTVYFTKEPFVSPIYEARDTKQRFMTAYAPIIDAGGSVVGLVAGDVSLKIIDSKLKNALIIIATCAAVTIFLGAVSVFFVANKISQPVQALKNAALSIAAGEYGETIQVKGPREIVELANAFNTMSECLEEHITRLRESSLARERLYGEYECSLLLQHHMLQKIVDDWDSPRFDMQLVKILSATPSRGLFLDLQPLANNGVQLFLAEANEPGFLGIYDLLSHGAFLPEQGSSLLKEYPSTITKIDSSLTISTHQMAPCLVWSLQSKAFVLDQEKVLLQKGDLILFYNQGFEKQFKSLQHLQDWLAKVLRHFGSENLESFTTILSRELGFLADKQNVDQDMYILCLKIKENH